MPKIFTSLLRLLDPRGSVRAVRRHLLPADRVRRVQRPRHRRCEAGQRTCGSCGPYPRFFDRARGGLSREDYRRNRAAELAATAARADARAARVSADRERLAPGWARARAAELDAAELATAAREQAGR